MDTVWFTPRQCRISNLVSPYSKEEYFKNHRTAILSHGVDYLYHNVIDYGKDETVRKKYLDADYKWFNKNRDVIYNVYSKFFPRGCFAAVNNQTIICVDTYAINVTYELCDIVPNHSYLNIQV